MRRILIATVAILAAVTFPVLAGEWHAGINNVCTDCHTMHFSMQHGYTGGPVTSTPQAGGNWLSTTGPNAFLLRAPANELCLGCHDGQTYAPDVFETNTNGGAGVNRGAGAINGVASVAPYDTYKGHTLDSTTTPPGWNPTASGAPATWYVPANGLECISCHSQHGNAAWYRNLGPYALGGAAGAARPTYVLGPSNDTTKDVWINSVYGSGTKVPPDPNPYPAGSGNSATFNPYYDWANVTYNRTDPTAPTGATTQTSNRMDTFCSMCHGDFHGGTGDTNIGGGTLGAAADGFLRHPTSKQVIGVDTNGGHSSLTRYVANTTKVKVYSSVAGFTDATPGCVSCHKSHGNQNPFGLILLNGNAPTVTEEGGIPTGIPTGDTAFNAGYRGLCGQCHGQGAAAGGF